MQPYQERVVNERAELAEKVNKLGAFLFTAQFDTVPREEQFRLARQHFLMSAYLAVLDERIRVFVK